jgi:hypothetical protein
VSEQTHIAVGGASGTGQDVQADVAAHLDLSVVLLCQDRADQGISRPTPERYKLPDGEMIRSLAAYFARLPVADGPAAPGGRCLVMAPGVANLVDPGRGSRT